MRLKKHAHAAYAAHRRRPARSGGARRAAPFRFGATIHLCGDGVEALRIAAATPPDLVVLDLGLPGLDGLEVCRRLRASARYVPILMLTSRSSDAERVLGLELGADDYLVKPFNVMELVARAKAIVRRMDGLANATGDAVIRSGTLAIDPAARRVTLAGTPIALTAREFDLLLHFALHPGRVFTREQLLDTVWAERTGDMRTRELAYQPAACQDRNRCRRSAVDPNGVGCGISIRRRGSRLMGYSVVLARIRSSLHVRLSLVLMALFILFALLAMLMRQFSATYEQEVAQRLNRNVAMYIARQQTVAAPAALNKDALAELFRYVMIVNPTLEVYLLDGRRSRARLRYRAWPGAAAGAVGAGAFVSVWQRTTAYPWRRPRSASNVVFSAAPVGDPAQPTGYVYAVLGGAAQNAAATAAHGSFGVSAALLSFAAAVLFLGVTGALLFRSLTGRLRELAQRVDQFEAGRFVAPKPVGTTPRGGDELTRLAQAFDAMAAKIAAQFAQIESIDLNRREAVLNASHDLRTPLAALQGYLQTLQIKSDVLTAEQRASYLAIAQRHVMRMAVLVEQMFALAKLDAPETAPSTRRSRSPNWPETSCRSTGCGAAEQGIALTASVDATVPGMWADIGMIERLIENLIDNALKFTPSGGTVRVEVRAMAQPGSIELTVTDSGCGISEQDLPRIFERFERGAAQPRVVTQHWRDRGSD